MKQALAFGLLSAAFVYAAYARGGYVWILVWPATSFVIAAVAYAGAGPGLMGKRAGGTIAPLSLLVNLPYFILCWLMWYVQRPFSGCASACRVAPGLWLARRPCIAEIPDEITTVVDLTAEFWAPRALRDGRKYVCIPTLDACCSPEQGFRFAVDFVVASHEPVLIHCAKGLGRSAALAAAVLIRRGIAPNVSDAERYLAQRRRGVHLTEAQRELVRRVTMSGKHVAVK